MSSINNTMSAFIFNDDVANSIATAINGTPKTAREIAKELGVDEHIINQHLYQMRDVVKTDDRVLILSLPENEDEEFKEDYDDHGVLCRYTEKDGWFPIEEHCVECGYKDCECEEEEEEHERLHANKHN